MARLPITNVNVSARSLRTNVGGPNTVADADAFGGSVGRALGQVGGMLEREGDQWAVIEERKRKEDASNLVAQADPTRTILEAANAAPADGSGLQKNTIDAFDNWVFEQTKDISDDKLRVEARNQLNRQRPQISSNAVRQEFALSAGNAKLQADTSINALNNKITSDPHMYDEYLKQGLDVIDSSTAIPAALREGVKAQWKQNSAQARFSGMLDRAKTVEDVDAIAAELAGPVGKDGKTKDDYVGKDWAKEFKPEDYDRTLNSLGTIRKAIVTKADADARAAIETLDARSGDTNAAIPEDELRAVQTLVKQSPNPVTVAKMARISRNEQLKKELKGATPAEIQGQMNAASGNPGVAYPGVPPRVSSAINKASEAFGVPASYLGAMVTREYGGNFKRQRPQTNGSFAHYTGTRFSDRTNRAYIARCLRAFRFHSVECGTFSKSKNFKRAFSTPYPTFVRSALRVKLKFCCCICKNIKWRTSKIKSGRTVSRTI